MSLFLIQHLSMLERALKEWYKNFKYSPLHIHKLIRSTLSYRTKISYLNKESLSVLAMGMALVINHYGRYSHKDIHEIMILSWNNMHIN